MEAASSFGYWLRRRRKSLDLTQEDLARRAGCATATIKKIEADARRPSRQLATRLANCLQLSPVDRLAFVKAARAVLSSDRLPCPDGPRPLSGLDGTSVADYTVTLLFADIAGDDRRAPGPMHDSRRATLRRAIEQHHGIVFRDDAGLLCGAFTRATAALAAAVDAQVSLCATGRGAAGAPGGVRMALHTGIVETLDAAHADPTIARGLHLLEAGSPGQILVSLATEELLRDQLGEARESRLERGLQLVDLGEHRLKDLKRPERIFQVAGAGLPADFPPLRTLDRRPHNLPAQTSLMVGREREVAEVCDLLRCPEVRLVTLTGPGGVGKTRLALQAAARLLADHKLPSACDDGIFLASLAPIHSARLVGAAIAQAVGAREGRGRSLIEHLKDYLRDRELILLLDNLEHLLDAAPLIAELLATAPRMKVLATSRAPLHLTGEHVYLVEPLRLPSPVPLPDGKACDVQALLQYDAVRLFVDRARSVRAGFLLTCEEAPAVVEICRRLDGLPLAIELAAARARLLSPAQLLADLSEADGPLRIAGGGPRDLPARQQTLRATIDWSYRLLRAPERTLMAQLGVFAGGATIEAVKAVCGSFATPGAHRDILASIEALVDQSLLRRAEGQPERFAMLETVRQYALERLEAEGEAEATRRRHAEHFAGLAETTAPKLVGPDQLAWLDRLVAEHDNFRAALAWCVGAGPEAAEVGLRLANALWWFWFVRGHLGEAAAWYGELLEASASTRTALRALALSRAGWVAWFREDVDAARKLYDASLALSTSLGDRHDVAEALQGLGLCASEAGEFGRATELFEQSLALFREVDDASSAAVLHHLGGVAIAQEDYARAETMLRESLDLSRRIGHRWGIGMCLLFLGESLIHRDEHRQAMNLLAEARVVFGEMGDRDREAAVLVAMGTAARVDGDQARAASCYDAALTLYRDLGNRTSIAAGCYHRAMVAIDRGETVQAAALLKESLSLICEIGASGLYPWLLAGLGACLTAQGLTERATRLFGAAGSAIDLLKLRMDPADRADLERYTARARAALGEEAFTVAWEAGSRMSLEEAIAETI